jgi:hypothetical protein
VSGSIRQTASFLLCASFTLVSVARETQAGDALMHHGNIIHLEQVSLWLKDRFSAAELEALGSNVSRVESYSCSCYDTPRPHYPYRIVLFITLKGDLVGRVEGHESAVSVTPLAVRNGNRYCKLEYEEQCYGAFADPCDFTDFRYGPYLRNFFPSCKADDSKAGLRLNDDGRE